MDVKSIYKRKGDLEIAIKIAELKGDWNNYYRLRKELKQLKEDFKHIFKEV